jgi:hypothetical protein
VDIHLRRLVRSFDLLNPPEGSSVFDIGPGNCFLLYLCRQLRGCEVAGIDMIAGDGYGKHAFRLFREQFGLADAIRHHVVRAYQPIDFAGRYHAIVATAAMFNDGWREAEYRFWLKDCFDHLLPQGRLMMHFNRIDPEPLAALPLLRPTRNPDHVKKLTIVSRETLGEVLEGKNTSARVTPVRPAGPS